jgi:hypothetical protein
MTVPVLNLSEKTLKNINYLNFMNNIPQDKAILNALSYKGLCGSEEMVDGTETFIKPLTNCCEAFSTADVSSNTIETGENKYALKHVYAGLDSDSKTVGSFNIDYLEKSNLVITKLHKIWFEYIQLVRTGKIKAFDTLRLKRILDYQSSLYFFALAPDGFSIDYWCKYTGVFPTAVPYSVFSGKLGPEDTVRISVPYAYVYKEDMEPEIFDDFNIVSAGVSNEKTWNDAIQAQMEATWDRSWSSSLKDKASKIWKWITEDEPSTTNRMKYLENVQEGDYNNIREDKASFISAKVVKKTVQGKLTFGLVFENNPDEE